VDDGGSQPILIGGTHCMAHLIQKKLQNKREKALKLVFYLLCHIKSAYLDNVQK
jgi:hypothetical protein